MTGKRSAFGMAYDRWHRPVGWSVVAIVWVWLAGADPHHIRGPWYPYACATVVALSVFVAIRDARLAFAKRS